MEQTKSCTVCHKIKTFSAFGPGRDRNKLRYDCKQCRNEKSKTKYATDPEASAQKMRNFRAAHPGQKLASKRIWIQNNKEHVANYQKKYFAKWAEENAEYKAEYAKAYYAENKGKIKAQRLARYYANKDAHLEYHRKYMNDRNKADVNFRLAGNLRHRIYAAIVGNKKGGSAVRDLGISVEGLKLHLESMFKEGMTWENYGPLWHVDHIIPLISFDLEDRTQFLAASHYTNLQPLWAEDNYEKGAKLD